MLSLLSLTVSVAAAAAPYAEYRVTIVGPPGSFPTDINQAGAVVGVWQAGPTTIRSFVNYGKGPLDLGLLGGSSNMAVAINDRGEVLGNWTTKNGQSRGYVYFRGSFRQLTGPGGRPAYYVDINNAGYILALGGPPPTAPAAGDPTAYLRAPNGKYQVIAALPYPNPTTQPEALNNRNQVTGESGERILPEIPFYAFVWSKGVTRQLGDFGYTPNYGLDINDRGQVAGYSDDLGAFVYRGKRRESLNALIDPRSGWNISFSRAINDAGQIAADGVRNGVRYAVQLDLIGPHALGTPAIEAGDEVDAAATAKAEGGTE